MNRDDVYFSALDEPLRDDVRVLGQLLGELLREQGGEALFHQVEQTRQAAITRREGEPARAREAETTLHEQLVDLPPAQATDLIHAFGAYFQLVNIAEKVHRIRRARDYARNTREAQPESLEEIVRQLGDAGLSLDEMRSLLNSIDISPVFTAHPTQATRRTILEKHLRIALRLVERMDPDSTPAEQRSRLERIRNELTAAWQTEAHPHEGRTVADEVDYVLFYLLEVIYRVIPPFYESLQAALEKVWGQAAETVSLPRLIRFASWVGGDMDGNPNVTAETVRATFNQHRQAILRRYRRELDDLYGQLSQSLSRVSVSEAVSARIREYEALFADVTEHLPPRHRNMPYRILLKLMDARLTATTDESEHRYQSPDQLLDDLQLIADSLAGNRGHNAGLFAINRLMMRVRTFGFHLATLDIRQHADIHRQVAGELLAIPDWEQRDPQWRAARLREALAGPVNEHGQPGELARQTLAVFEAVADGRSRHGADAFGPWIVSMTRDVDDVLAVLYLARQAGLCDDAGRVPLDVVPLLETPEDLAAGPDILKALLTDDNYRGHLHARGNLQMMMVGYSDSNKSGGLVGSRWAVQTTQQQLAAIASAAGVGIEIFHGRGGTASRGGTKVHGAVLAAPPEAVQGRFRVTEQGEIIDANYGLRPIALRTMEQMTSGVLLASAPGVLKRREDEQWPQIMQSVADTARDSFRALVYQDPRFDGYFRQATPIDVIERMRIGSRPPSRGRGGRIEDLRAIPWVFAWTQSRHLLSGWYGLGTGLNAAVDQFGIETVRDMAGQWPFLRNLLDDAEMVLAKTDMNIARRYAELAEEPSHSLFKIIQAEYERTHALILELKGIDALLDRDPHLQRSMRLRNPYVDPLSLLQIELLARWRASDCKDGALLQALIQSVMAIAHGLQNTG